MMKERDGTTPPKGGLVTAAEALGRILAAVRPLAPAVVPLEEASGCVLARDAVAPDPHPPFTNAAMDGYALRCADVAGASAASPVRLAVGEDLPAGRIARTAVAPGCAARIMTGAPLPEGADAVVMVEKTGRDGEGVRVFSAVREGENVRLAGEDVPAGSVAVPAGKRLGPGDIGLLAALGFASVDVVPRPRVAILSTGDELVRIDEPLTAGRVRNSNAYALAAQAVEAGAVPRIMGIARDREDDLRARIAESLAAADAVVTSGGISTGDYDFVKRILGELGRMLFWKVAIKPGKPLAFGVVEGKPLFGLPGNPTAAMISFEQFVRPALHRMAGRPLLGRVEIEATLAERVMKKPGRRTYVAVSLARDGSGWSARPSGPQGGAMLCAMSRADGLVALPEAAGSLETGARVRVLLLRPEETLAVGISKEDGKEQTS